jgi:hypothetical protein
MKIVGLAGMDGHQLADELQRGAKFVVYQYCVSALVVTFKRPSDIYFLRAGESAVGKGLPFTALSLVLGWWGIPWGPIHTIGSVVTNFQGGKIVTQEVLATLREGS